MKYPAVMIDLETLGTTPTAAIIQIGLVAFSYEPDAEMQQMTVNVDPGHIHYPFSADWDTIKWWMGQSEAARQSVTKKALPPEVAALSVVKFFETYAKPKCNTWALSTTFDIPILENLLRTYNFPLPFKFYKVQEMRTLNFIYPDIKRVTPEVAHDAGADAKAQAQYVARVVKELRGKKIPS